MFKVFIIILCIFSSQINLVYAKEEITYTVSDISSFISEDDYIDFIRSSLFQQPEFKYAVSLTAEQEFNLKYAKEEGFIFLEI